MGRLYFTPMSRTLVGMDKLQIDYKVAEYRNRIVRYTDGHIVYKKLFIPMRVVRICTGALGYVETGEGKIFETRDFVDFAYVSDGALLSVIGDLVMYEQDGLYVYNGRRHMAVRFFWEGDELGYTMDVDGGGRACVVPDLLCGYEDGLVVAKERSLLFMDLVRNEEVRCGFTDRIERIYESERCGVRMLVVLSGRKMALFYGSNPIGMKDRDEPWTKCLPRLEAIEELVLEGLDKKERAGVLRGASEAALERAVAKAAERVAHGGRSIAGFLEKGVEYEKHCRAREGSLTSCTRALLGVLETYRSIATQSQMEEVPGGLRHYYRRVPVDLENAAFLSRVYTRRFFYDSQVKEHDSLAYRIISYERMSGTGRQPRNTRRIYRAIRRAAPLSDPQCRIGRLSSWGNALRVAKGIHGDSRATEIVDILRETTISIGADIDDIDAIRQKAFLARVLAGTGLSVLCHGLPTNRHRLTFAINEGSVAALVTPQMAFFLGFYYEAAGRVRWPAATEPAKIEAMQIGRDLSKAMRCRLSDAAHQKYMRQLTVRPEGDPYIRYILLLLAMFRRKSKSINGDNGNCNNNKHSFSRFRNKNRRFLNELSRKYHITEEQNAPLQNAHCLMLNAIFSTFLNGSDLETKKAAIVAFALRNAGSGNAPVFALLIQECEQTGPCSPAGNSGHYNQHYRVLAALSAALVCPVRRPVTLQDSFAALIINGLSLIDTRTYQSCLFRNDDSSHPVIFYATLFSLVNTFYEPVADTLSMLESIPTAQPSLVEIHKLAACAFYIGLKHLHNGNNPTVHSHSNNVEPNENICNKRTVEQQRKQPITDHSTQRLLSIVLALEDRMVSQPALRVIFDFALISLSLILNASFDLVVLRILRRQILATTLISDRTGQLAFVPSEKRMVRFYGPGYESIVYYKLCMGLVCASLGNQRLSVRGPADIRTVITAFFYSRSAIFSGDMLEIMRSLIVRSLVRSIPLVQASQSLSRNIRLRIIRKTITKLFIAQFEKMEPIDRKFTIDILSDFYENHGQNTKHAPLLDQVLVAKILAIIN